MAYPDESSVDIVIEWPVGEPDRHEWFEATDSIARVHAAKEAPPEHYGCVPGAVSPGDGELLDVFLVDDGPRRPGDRLRARLIGVLLRSDGDNKLVAVDPASSALRDVADLTDERVEAMWRWMRRHVRLRAAGPENARLVLEQARRAWQITKES